MASKHYEAIKHLVPEDLRDKCGAYYSKRDQKYFVFMDVGYKYDSATQHSVAERISVGSVKDDTFTYSKKFLLMQETQRLKMQLATISQDKPEENKTQEKKSLGNKKGVKKVADMSPAVALPPQAHEVLYPLNVVLFVALLASLTGRTSAVSMATYWRTHREELSQLVDNFPKENISHDTLNRLFSILDPAQLSALLQRAFSSLEHDFSRIIHRNGQAIRASRRTESAIGHFMLSASVDASTLCLRTRLIGEENNDISYAIAFFEKLNLGEGDMLTAHAMPTQVKMIQYLCQQGAGYCLAVRENQPKLEKDCLDVLTRTQSEPIYTYEMRDAEHGRIDVRHVEMVSGRYISKSLLNVWTGLEHGSVARVSSVTEKKNPKKSHESTGSEITQQLFITTLAASQENAKRIANMVSNHGFMDTTMHWSLDLNVNQDRMERTHETYLQNRALLSQLGANFIQAAKKSRQDQGLPPFSIPTFVQMAQTPSGALEVLATIPDLQRVFEG